MWCSQPHYNVIDGGFGFSVNVIAQTVYIVELKGNKLTNLFVVNFMIIIIFSYGCGWIDWISTNGLLVLYVHTLHTAHHHNLIRTISEMFGLDNDVWILVLRRQGNENRYAVRTFYTSVRWWFRHPENSESNDELNDYVNGQENTIAGIDIGYSEKPAESLQL